MTFVRGAAAMLLACALIAGGAAPASAAPPPHDNFANATVLASSTSVTISGSNVDATNEAGENVCCFFHHSVWYRWTAPKTGNYRVELCGSAFNTHLQVVTGAAVNQVQQVADNAGDAGCGDGTRSRATFVATAGTEYRIRVGSDVQNQTGTISGTLALVSPPNDFFADAATLEGTSASISATNVDATTETNESGGFSSVWYRWTAPKTGNYRLEVCGSSFNTHLRVATGNASDALEEVAANDDDAGCGPDGKRSRLTFVAGAGQEYRIRIASQVQNQTGTISGSLALVSPPNDFFADAGDLGSGGTASFTGTNVDATTESGEPTCCVTASTVWYRWTAPAAGSYRIETCGSDFRTHLKVLRGTAVNALERVAENSGEAGCGEAGDRAAVTFTAGTNATYYIQIGSAAELRGTIRGSIAPLPAPPPPAAPAPTQPAPQVFPGALPPASRPPISGRGVTRRRGKYVLRVKGTIKLPPGLTKAQACSGVIIITVKRGRTLITARTTKLTSRCTYAKTIRIARGKIRRAKRLGLTVRVGGNAYLAAVQRNYRVKVRR